MIYQMVLAAADTTSAAEEVAEVTQDTVEEVSRMTQILQDNIPQIISFAFQVVLALVFFFIGRCLIKWVRKVVRRSFERSKADTGVATFVDSLLKYGLYFLLIFSIAARFGVDTASVAALVASSGVTLGLALQGSLSNFAGGVLILLLKPFEVGDYIVEDTNMKEGTVKEIQIFYTKLSTIDNQTIVIPNGMLTNNSLTNATAKDERRLDREAKSLIEKIVTEDPCVMQDKEILVFVDDLAESAVVIGARAWVRNEEFWPTKWRILEEIKLKLDENGIAIPYPQVTVHMQEKK